MDQAPPHFATNILAFGRLLRRAGVEVPHSSVLDALGALRGVDVGRRADVRATLRALFVHRHDDLAPFDRAFDLFFRDHTASSTTLPLFSLGERPRVVVRPLSATSIDVSVDSVSDEASPPTTRAVGAYSATAVSRTRDFADFSAAELEHARRVLMELPWRLSTRRTRRWQRARAGIVDLRPTMRRLLTRGDVFDLAHRRRTIAPRPIVVIGDVSGSMERYSRLLLHFIHGLSHQGRHVESFVFATSLTHLSRRMADSRNADRLTRAIRDVADWGGGTRIGDALRTFNTTWARRVMRHGPVVLLVSDGWDRGDPAVLVREITRLRRMCRRLIWLNPLLGSATYEPLTRGMQAALPHVDDFLPVHNIASLEQLAMHLRRLA